MNNKNIKRKQKTYLNKFILDESGQYIYNGDTYRLCDNCRMTINSLKLRLTISVIVTLGFILFAGCLPVDAMMQVPYVVIPYMISVVVLFRYVYAIVMLVTNSYPLREYIYQSTILKFDNIFSILIFFITITLLGFMIFNLLHNINDKIFLSILFILSESLSIAMILYQKKIIKLTSWELDK